MKVSIIIPVYNVSRYIERCLNSVAAQIYPDIECILVDDCSQDHSVEIIYAYLATYAGNVDFKVFRLAQNRGPSFVRNIGLEHASGEYVYFLDSDDEITVDCINNLVALVEKYEDVDLVQGNTLIVGSAKENERLAYMDISKLQLPEYSNNHLWIKKSLLTIIPDTAWSKLVRRKILLEYNIRFKEGVIHEDIHWRFFLSKYVQTMAISKTPTYKYCVNENSIMMNPDRTRSYADILTVVEDCLRNVDPVLKNVQLTSLLRHLLSRRIRARVDLANLKAYNKVYSQFVDRILNSNANLFTKLCVIYLKLPSAVLKQSLFLRFFGFWMRTYDRFGPKG